MYFTALITENWEHYPSLLKGVSQAGFNQAETNKQINKQVNKTRAKNSESMHLPKPDKNIVRKKNGKLKQNNKNK